MHYTEINATQIIKNKDKELKFYFHWLKWKGEKIKKGLEWEHF